ncbi:phage tail protein [Paenibacillus sp. P46E]|uniref:phage tail-collar fiber domain-containing protein n=1 Tax=Paenibacillus sp. P46E TaxID=1349436 RepID=UPI00093DC0B3|nr:phage tail protein [Paenibacillus sp. P46E]OKP97772.1 hypothetical protein A3849_13790 [Paenibacillus sp. P46E]
MAVFGGMSLTNKGLVLQGKAQAGTQLNYTRIAVGDGSLSGQSVPALNGLISLKKNLPISRLRPQPPNKAVIGATLSNADITTGFFFREIGVFAQDPDVGEILYAYANAGVTADYIAAGGGSDIIEKAIDCVVIVGTAANITAMIDNSLVFALKSELDAVAAVKVDKISGKGLSTNDFTNAEKNKLADITAGAGGPGSANDTVIGNRTADPATTTAYGLVGTLTQWLSWIAKYFQTITGTTNPFDAPAITLAATRIHVNDNTRHISSAERTTWNAKETPAGAQTKADAARDAAIAASISTGQRGIAGGVAALDAKRNVLADGILLPGYSLSRYAFSTAPSVANQKMDFYFPFEGVSGYIEVEVSGTWSFGQSQGKLVKRINIIANATGGIDSQTSEYTDVTGPVQDSVAISDLKSDTTNSRFVITLEMLNSQGNTFTVLIRRHSPFAVTPLTMGTVYTGTATTLPRAVQTVPNDTTTQSGQKLLNEASVSGIGKLGNYITNADILYDNGFYNVPATWTGSPFPGSDGANQGYLNHFTWDVGGLYAHQVFMPINTGDINKKSFRYRRRINGVWDSTWTTLFGTENSYELFIIRHLFVTGNVDNYTDPGTYVFFEGSYTNGPAAGMSYGLLKVFVGFNGFLEQEAISVTSPYTKSYRSRTETVWGPWRRILTDVDSTSFAGTFAPIAHEHSRLVATTTTRDIRPSLTGKGQFAPYFVSRSGLNGAVSTDYSDMIVLNTYDDASGGKVNALVFDKSTFQIFHYQAAQTDAAWGNPMTLAYANTVSKTRSNDKEFLVSTTAANTLVSAASFTSSANVTVKAYLRLTAAATVEIAVWYQDAGGANTAYIVPSKAFTAAGGYCFVPLFLNVASGSGMNVVTTCSVANAARISVVIEEA